MSDVVRTAIRLRRLFVSGQQVEYWEHPDVLFGWGREDLRSYEERGDWVLLFNAIVLAAPGAQTEHAS